MTVHCLGFQVSLEALQEQLKPSEGCKPRAWWLAKKVVYPSGVKWTIKSFYPYKVPGTDGIYPILLQEGFSHLLEPLLKSLRQVLL